MSVSTADGDIRYVPGEQKQRDLTVVAHESRYIWLTDTFDVKGLSVVDFGCGSGYGAGYLASHGARVTGVDISPGAIEYAARAYPGASFQCMDLTAPQCVDSIGRGGFDLVVSFDVIEHVEKFWAFVENIQALLKPGGTAVVGCPNRLATFDYNHEWNPFHSQEFTPSQLNWLLGIYFGSVEMYAQDFRSDAVRSQYTVTARPFDFYAKQALLQTPLGPLLLRLKERLQRPAKAAAADAQAPTLERDDIITFSRIDMADAGQQRRPFGLVAICRKT